jgi:KRAB domain-containing zinc finger protein
VSLMVVLEVNKVDGFRPEEIKYKTFTCDLCSQECDSQNKLIKHRRLHSEPRFACMYCDDRFRTRTELNKHVWRSHDSSDFDCPFCGYVTESKLRFRLHVISKHTKDYPYRCDTCGMGYLTQTLLRVHNKAQHEGVRFVCEDCKKVFRYADGLRQHRKTHDPHRVEKSFMCEICSKVLRKKFSLERHLEAHKGVRQSFVCEECGKILSSTTSLKQHKTVHSAKKYICDVCGKRFGRKGNLQIHMLRVHIKEKPFKCTVCDKNFASKMGLDIHVRSHTGNKPYKCETCQKEYSAKHLLTKHKCTKTVS